jgi:hypothetical protein
MATSVVGRPAGGPDVVVEAATLDVGAVLVTPTVVDGPADLPAPAHPPARMATTAARRRNVDLFDLIRATARTVAAAPARN